MRILVATDAWEPQVNGVVRTLRTVGRELSALGHAVEFVTPNEYPSVPLPTYAEIRLALAWRKIARRIADWAPDAIHIATEGPIGWAARSHARAAGLPFTTSFHTRFPEYIEARSGIPSRWGYAVLRRFHGAARTTMVASAGLRDDLLARGFGNLALWGRGVETETFHPRWRSELDQDPRPILLYVGRVAIEKNVEAFLRLPVPGTKYVVGDKRGEELSRFYASADVFVFPSLTDTFGNVVLEALASGVPVAAFPVTGPKDVIGDAPVGALDADLASAVIRAQAIDRNACRAFALERTWRHSAEKFLGNLVPLPRPHAVAPITAARALVD
jgi:glycosyltransferase involved in cell wall biosynthesis